MSKNRHQRPVTDDFGSVALLDAPEVSADDLPPIPAPPPEPKAAGPGEWRIALKSNWTAPFIVMVGCSSEEEARAELHRYLDLAISNVQRTGR